VITNCMIPLDTEPEKLRNHKKTICRSALLPDKHLFVEMNGKLNLIALHNQL